VEPGTTVERRSEEREGLRMRTLLIAAVASGAAAIITSEFWRRGTAISAALTPVIVALISEALHKPAERVSQITTVRGALPPIFSSARRAERSAAARPPDAAPVPGDAERAIPPGATAPERAAPEPAGAAADRPLGDALRDARTDAPPTSPDAPERVRIYRRRKFRLGVALGTGLAAFLIAAVALTVPELLGGGAIGGDGSTTLFSTKDKKEQRDAGGSDRQRSTDDGGDSGGQGGDSGGGSRSAPRDEPRQPQGGQEPGGEAPPSPAPEAPSSPTP